MVESWTVTGDITDDFLPGAEPRGVRHLAPEQRPDGGGLLGP